MQDGLLIVGCKGRVDCGIQLCGGTSFVLLDIGLVDPNDQKFFDYLFKVMKLANKPLTDYNAFISLSTFLAAYLPDEKYQVLCSWIRIHKNCGLYMYRASYDIRLE